MQTIVFNTMWLIAIWFNNTSALRLPHFNKSDKQNKKKYLIIDFAIRFDIL